MPRKRVLRKTGWLGQLRDHFIPHEGNDYVPHVLKHRALFWYGTIMIVVKALLVIASLVLPSATVFSSAITSANIVELTNAARSSAGLTALVENSKLDAAAQQKAVDMLRGRYFSHVSPSGITPWDWIKRSGYAYRVAGENLAVHFVQAEDAEAGWMASPTHRANILDPRFQDIGVGVMQGTFENTPSIIVVQMFGLPRTGKVVASLGEALPSPDLPPVSLAPTARGYNIRATVADASSVHAYAGSQWANLEKASSSNVWQGSLSVESTPISNEPQTLYLSIKGLNAGAQAFPVAVIASKATAQDFYAFQHDVDTRKSGWLTFAGLHDAARRFYFITIVFLSAALLLSILVKIHIQRHAVIAHTALIIVLAVVLSSNFLF